MPATALVQPITRRYMLLHAPSKRQLYVLQLHSSMSKLLLRLAGAWPSRTCSLAVSFCMPAGGANVPALNDLLGTFGIALGDAVLEGDTTLEPDRQHFASGTHIQRFPAGGYVHGQFLQDKAVEGDSKLWLGVLVLRGAQEELTAMPRPAEASLEIAAVIPVSSDFLGQVSSMSRACWVTLVHLVCCRRQPCQWPLWRECSRRVWRSGPDPGRGGTHRRIRRL